MKDSTYPPLRISAGDEILHMPFRVNIRDVSDEDVLAMMQRCQQVLGAEHFREADLTMEVLQDFREKAAVPRNFLYGPYLAVNPLPQGGIRVGVVQDIDGGTTVYAVDQFEVLLGAIERADLDFESVRGASRPKE